MSFFILGTLPLKPFGSKNIIICKCDYRESLSSSISHFFLFLGVLGLLISIIYKFVLLDFHPSLLSFANRRVIATEDFLYVESIYFNISWLGFLLYPAGFVGLVSVWINFENANLKNTFLFFMFIFLIILYSITSSSRINILVVMAFIFIASLLRKVFDNSFIPRVRFLRFFLFFLALFFLFYSAYIFNSRASSMGFDNYIGHIQNVWGVRILPKFLFFLNSYCPDFLKKIVISFFVYLLQNLSVTEKFLLSGHHNLMFGSFTSDVINSLFRVSDVSSNYLRLSQLSLNKANIYGFFSGAWTGSYIDFGYFSYLFIFIWGKISGYVYRLTLGTGEATYIVSYVAIVFTIFFSFISAPGGVANSTLILLWFFCSHLLYKFKEKNFSFFLKKIKRYDS
jgi:hypothetical protein